MEVIKKTVKMAMTISGVTENEFVVVPDLNTSYKFKILLTSQVRDIGFFDDIKEDYEVEGCETSNDLNELD
jgi:hypothetical protein